MDTLFPAPVETGTPLSPPAANAALRQFLATRRSTGKKTLSEPGPSPVGVAELLRVAARVPDHRKLEPWRFIVLQGDQRRSFGDILGDIYRAAHPGEDDAKVEENASSLPMRAPVVIAVVSSPDVHHKTPVWEQELSAGAVCYNLLLAAGAAGWAGCWLTEWIAYDAVVATRLGLVTHERIAGFIYLGTATADAPERPRPDMASKITRWEAPPV